MKFRDILIKLIGARNPNCPNDADVLAYTEGRLAQGSRANFERHFTHCDDCRHVLACLGRKADESSVPVTEDAISAQTNRVLAYINEDERNRNRPATNPQPAAGFAVSYPKLASAGLTVAAIAIAGFFILSPQSPSDAAMDALKLAVKDKRFTEARVSGGLDHSRYAGTTRGGADTNDDLNLGRAENKVKAVAEQNNAAVENRHVLARVYLARGTRAGATQALAILNQLVETPEILNDIGVAHFERGDYEDAIAAFSKALAKSPNYNEALFNRALAEGFAHHIEDAQRDWQQFIDQSSDDDKWKSEGKAFRGALSTGNR